MGTRTDKQSEPARNVALRQEVFAHLPRHIDISCVQAPDTRDDIKQLAADARAYDFMSAHVLPQFASEALELLKGSNTKVGSPVGFPSGGHTTATKIAEASELLDRGIQELDMVIPIGRLRSGDLQYTTDQLGAVAQLVDGKIPMRAILEVGLLSDDQIRDAVSCAISAGVPWIKTATGWTGIPTTVHHMEVIAEAAAGRARLKAAGGIRDLETIGAMAELGVERFGINRKSAIACVEEINHG